MKKLKVARERSGYTQAQLAEAIGTTQQTIARWEGGKAEPNLAALRDLALCLGTSVDALLGNNPYLRPETTNPFSRFRGDDTGYWGNIGIRLPHTGHSRWYPVTSATMKEAFSAIQSPELYSWLQFQTLNNKMVVLRPGFVQSVRFLDEACDEIEGDWEVGPGDVEGLDREVYECMEHILSGSSESQEFSPKLVELTQKVIEENKLTENQLLDLCVKSRISYKDGTSVSLMATPYRIADSMLYLDTGIEDTGTAMLHLNDAEKQDIFLPLSTIILIEFPLTQLRPGIEEIMRKRDPQELA